MGLFRRKKDQEPGISRYDGILHIGGLDAPEHCKASAVLGPAELTVSCGANEFVLPISKIRNVEHQMDIEEKQYQKSSVAKGVLGAATFGVSGAVIGSAPKTKTKREVTSYVIISYESAQGDYKTFVLRDEYSTTAKCAELSDALRPRITVQMNRVEL